MIHIVVIIIIIIIITVAVQFPLPQLNLLCYYITNIKSGWEQMKRRTKGSLKVSVRFGINRIHISKALETSN